ncbi:MAG: chemoreceptor glutamine deamidase CheD [Calditrichaeota bacterium]|nr:chemoreceptor glutamine deamidase CheD [Calditrichota bacterium]
MQRRHNEHFKRDVVDIVAGEYYVSRDAEIVTTLLGSCVATCLFDPEVGVGGMNHFMLPGQLQPGPIFASEAGRYGMFAMERLINELLKMGARREKLVAKVFGGANLLGGQNDASRVPEQNVLFTLEYLQLENIPVLISDVGGTVGRRIYMFTDSGRVLLKRLGGKPVRTVARREVAYQKNLREREGSGSKVEWFRN